MIFKMDEVAFVVLDKTIYIKVLNRTNLNRNKNQVIFEKLQVSKICMKCSKRKTKDYSIDSNNPKICIEKVSGEILVVLTPR